MGGTAGFPMGSSKVTTPKPESAIQVNAGQNITVFKGSDEPAVLYVGTAAAGATLKVRSAGGDDATFVNIQQGSFIPVQVKRVYKTGTTASNIVALF